MKRTIIYAKCIVVDDDVVSHYRSVVDALSALEDAAQSYGWGEVKVVEDDFGDPPQFSQAPYPYD